MVSGSVSDGPMITSTIAENDGEEEGQGGEKGTAIPEATRATSPEGKRLSKSVSIARLDDLDEHGRFKDGIQALIYSLQKEIVPTPAEEDRGGVGAENSIASAVSGAALSIAQSATGSGGRADIRRGSMSADGEQLAEMKETVAVDTRPWPQRMHDSVLETRRENTGGRRGESYAVTSGIVLLTGNGSRTLADDNVDIHHAPNLSPESVGGKEISTDAMTVGLESCFLALYNPKDMGNVPYCAEVNVCGPDVAVGQQAALDESMGAYCVFPPTNTQSQYADTVMRRKKRDVVCVLHSTLSGDSAGSIGLLVRLADSLTGQVLFEATFVVPVPPLGTINTHTNA